MRISTTHKICEQCGNEFDTSIPEQRFCNIECLREYKLQITLNMCHLCGKRISKHSYLCPECKPVREMSYKLRFEILKRDGFTCQYCGKTVKDGIKLHIDHRIPISKGGSNAPDNLVTSCEECNRGKSTTLLNEEYEVSLVK